MRGYALAVIQLSVFQALLASVCAELGCHARSSAPSLFRTGLGDPMVVSVFSDSLNGSLLTSLVLPESTARGSCPSELAATRRTAYEDGRPLLPRLADLGVHVSLELPGVGGAVGTLLHPYDGQWVVVLSPNLNIEDQERVVSALFAKELEVDAERPLVIIRRDATFCRPHLTWCPEGCITDHSCDVCKEPI